MEVTSQYSTLRCRVMITVSKKSILSNSAKPETRNPVHELFFTPFRLCMLRGNITFWQRQINTKQYKQSPGSGASSSLKINIPRYLNSLTTVQTSPLYTCYTVRGVSFLAILIAPIYWLDGPTCSRTCFSAVAMTQQYCPVNISNSLTHIDRCQV